MLQPTRCITSASLPLKARGADFLQCWPAVDSPAGVDGHIA
jgi:hypothetical protein